MTRRLTAHRRPLARALYGRPGPLRDNLQRFHAERDADGCPKRCVCRVYSLVERGWDSLAGDNTERVRRALSPARRKPAGPRVLSRAALCGATSVREAAAINPTLPARAQRMLADDASSAVRASLARNPRVLPSLLAVLAADEDGRVRWRVATNLRLRADTSMLLAADHNPTVRRALLENAGADSDSLEILCRDDDHEIRRAVALNERAPEALLRRLVADPDGRVRSAAENRLLGLDRHLGLLRDACHRPVAPPRPAPQGDDPGCTSRYRASDDSNFKFEFRPLGHRPGWRVNVLEMPSYRERDRGEYATHLYNQAGTPYICWSTPILGLEQAVEVAAMWAEATIVYIATGRFSVPCDRPEVSISPDTSLAVRIEQHA